MHAVLSPCGAPAYRFRLRVQGYCQCGWRTSLAGESGDPTALKETLLLHIGTLYGIHLGCPEESVRKEGAYECVEVIFETVP